MLQCCVSDSLCARRHLVIQNMIAHSLPGVSKACFGLFSAGLSQICLPVQEPDPPLHEAAKAGDADKVRRLLEEGADPCQADTRGKVPYDVAADKAVRDAFRRSVDRQPISCGVTSVTPLLIAHQEVLYSFG